MSLAILIHVARQQFNHSGKPSWPNWQFGPFLNAASKFNVQDTSPELQNEFCALWNEIVHKVQSDDYGVMAQYILGQIRNIYIALHQGTDSAPTHFSASTGDRDVVLRVPASYPECKVPGHMNNNPSTPLSLHNNTALAPPFLASPDPPSSSVPAPLHIDKTLTDVSPLDGVHPAHQTTTESLQEVTVTSPDPATIGPPVTKFHPTPKTPSSASPYNPVLDSILPTGPPLSSHSPITRPDLPPSFPESPSASPGVTSTPDLGATDENDGSLGKEKDALDPPLVNRATRPRSTTIPSTITDPDEAVAGPSLQGPSAERTGDHSRDSPYDSCNTTTNLLQ